MELKEGMYVRTYDGYISQYRYYELVSSTCISKALCAPCNGNFANVEDIKQMSFNIIDLIEEGDLLEIEYLSRRYVERITDLFKVKYSDEKNKIFESSQRNFRIKNKEFSERDKMVDPIIKKIITKEQLDSVAYSI